MFRTILDILMSLCDNPVLPQLEQFTEPEMYCPTCGQQLEWFDFDNLDRSTVGEPIIPIIDLDEF
ncbi:hypothetical protein JXQ70_06690 [bacterium]|nr:hypothetical protein [bacterium]